MMCLTQCTDVAQHRHIVLEIQYQEAFQRQFKDGKEVEVIQQDTQKVRTGYLHSSYKVGRATTQDDLRGEN